MEWKRVRVFISSTFNDMHAERDYLVKQVFPALSEWCEEKKLKLIDIDLRWGVSTDDAQNNNTILTCLNSIDESRPFFLCFLGQRRGWIPEINEVSDETLNEYPEVKKYVGNHSITEMEIEHALLSPMYHIAGEMENHPDAVDHALFFFRDAGYLDMLNNAQKEIFTNASDSDELQSDRKLGLFKDRIRQNSGCVFSYSATWDSEMISHELTQRGEAIYKGRLTDFRCENRKLSDFILEKLEEEIEKEFPGRKSENNQDELEKDIERQSFFEEQTSDGYIERKGDFDSFYEYIQNNNDGLFVVTAPAGQGKTSRLARLSQILKQGCDYRVITRFCGATDGCNTVFDVWKSILKETGVVLPPDESSLISGIDNILDNISDYPQETIIIIDALNQIKDGLSMFRWLPRFLPYNVKLIVSMKEDDTSADLLTRLSMEENTEIHSIKPFESEEDKRLLINAYFKNYLKKIDENQLQEIIKLPASSNPLFLNVILSELRVFGSFEQLSNEIRKYGDNAVSAFDRVLSRMENDIGISGVPSSEIVPELFGLLSASRNGLSEIEILSSLSEKFNDYPIEDVTDAIHVFIRQERSMLTRREGRWDFFYESFKIAAQNRYSGSMKENHEKLYKYFYNRTIENKNDFRAFAETAFQLYLADNEDKKPGEKIIALLSDAAYIVGKNRVCGIDQLIEDYRIIPGDLRPKILEDIVKTLRLSSHILRKTPEMILNQLCGRLGDSQETGIKELLKKLRSMNKGPALIPICRTMKGPGDVVVATLTEHSSQVTALGMYEDYIVSGDESGVIRIWDTETWTCQRIIRAYYNLPVFFVEDECELMTFTHFEDMTIVKKWDLFSGMPISVQTIEGKDEYKAPSYYYMHKHIGQFYFAVHGRRIEVRLSEEESMQKELPVSLLIPVNERDFFSAGLFESHTVPDKGSELEKLFRINRHDGDGNIISSIPVPRMDYANFSENKLIVSMFYEDRTAMSFSKKRIQIRDEKGIPECTIKGLLKFETGEDNKVRIVRMDIGMSMVVTQSAILVNGTLFYVTEDGCLMAKAPKESNHEYITYNGFSHLGSEKCQLFMFEGKLTFLEYGYSTGQKKHVSILRTIDTDKRIITSEKQLDFPAVAVVGSDRRTCYICNEPRVCYSDYSIRVCDNASGKELFIREIDMPYSRLDEAQCALGISNNSLKEIKHFENTIAFADGKIILTAHDHIDVIDDTNGELICSEFIENEEILSVLQHNGRVYVGTYSGRVLTFDTDYFELDHSAIKNGENEYSLAYCKYEKPLAAAPDKASFTVSAGKKIGTSALPEILKEKRQEDIVWDAQWNDDGQIRMGSIDYVESEKVLVNICLDEKITSIRCRAAEKITDQAIIKNLMQELYFRNTEKDFDVFCVLADKCTDEYFLYFNIASSSEKINNGFSSLHYSKSAAIRLKEDEYRFAALESGKIRFKYDLVTKICEKFDSGKKDKQRQNLWLDTIILTVPDDPSKSSSKEFASIYCADKNILMLYYAFCGSKQARDVLKSKNKTLFNKYDRLDYNKQADFERPFWQYAGKLTDDIVEESARLQKELGVFTAIDMNRIYANGAIYHPDPEKRIEYAKRITDPAIMFFAGCYARYVHIQEFFAEKIRDAEKLIDVLNNFEHYPHGLIAKEYQNIWYAQNFCNIIKEKNKNQKIVAIAERFTQP